MIREGEESQEDSLKIRSDENFPASWLWILRSLLVDSLSSCDSKLKKRLNSQTWQNHWTTKIMHGRWKFDQKLKNWTWLHMMIFSFRIMKKHVSFDYEISFMRLRWNCVFAIRGEKLCLMEIDERKSFEVMEIMLCVWETSDKFEFSYLEKFFSLNKLWWNGKYLKLKLNPLFSRKSQVNSHSWALLLLSKAKMHKWVSWGQKWGVI